MALVSRQILNACLQYLLVSKLRVNKVCKKLKKKKQNYQSCRFFFQECKLFLLYILQTIIRMYFIYTIYIHTEKHTHAIRSKNCMCTFTMNNTRYFNSSHHHHHRVSRDHVKDKLSALSCSVANMFLKPVRCVSALAYNISTIQHIRIFINILLKYIRNITKMEI